MHEQDGGPVGGEFITRLIQDARNGGETAHAELMQLVYADLRKVAGAVFAAERANHTLQPTALVHEAWVKLAGQFGEVEDRKHFLAIASQAMRRVLTDHARGANREKRGGSARRVALPEEVASKGMGELDLFDLEDSLTKLAQLNERHARVVELRFLGGLTIQEVAEVLGVSHATVEADWFTARAWLRTELGRRS